MTAGDAHRAIEAVYRIESPRLIAGLTRLVRDVGLAEDLAQPLLVDARDGVGGAAGGPGHDQAYRPVGPRGLRAQDGWHRHTRGSNGNELTALHGCFLRWT